LCVCVYVRLCEGGAAWGGGVDGKSPAASRAAGKASTSTRTEPRLATRNALELFTLIRIVCEPTKSGLRDRACPRAPANGLGGRGSKKPRPSSSPENGAARRGAHPPRLRRRKQAPEIEGRGGWGRGRGAGGGRKATTRDAPNKGAACAWPAFSAALLLPCCARFFFLVVGALPPPAAPLTTPRPHLLSSGRKSRRRGARNDGGGEKEGI
jgi:hypothetical protein